MVFPRKNTESAPLLTIQEEEIPEDSFHLAYIFYFIMGSGIPLPTKAFTTAIDYFTYNYPGINVNRIFSMPEMLLNLITMIMILAWAHKSSTRIRINIGLGLCIVGLSTVPLVDLVYLKGRTGLYLGYYVTVAMDAICGSGVALVESGVVGSAGELPNRYLQVTASGMAASGLLVSVFRILTKALYPQNADGLRSSANLYFGISILVIFICLICCNISHKLPIIQYYNDLKMQSRKEEQKYKNSITISAKRSNLWDIAGRVKWFGLARAFVHFVSHSIFPGHLTEDMRSSSMLKDWYPILLITCYNLFNLVGMLLPAVYLLKSEEIAVKASFARVLFYPLFLVSMHGPEFFQTEIPVGVLTALLGLSNGYVATVLMILAPKAVPIQHSETAGIVIVLFASLGLTVGSAASWLWII